MKETALQALVREKLGLRVGKEMAAYLARRLRMAADGKIPIIGGDARTGVAIRREVPADDLRPFVQGQS